jgi:hypothetical protein
METQQMMELLLARMNANIEEHMQEMMAGLETNQAQLEVDRKADQEEIKENLLARLEAKTEANQAKMDIKLKEMSEEIKSGQAEMRSTVNAWIADMTEDQKERTACQAAMEANPEKMEPNPGEQEATVEWQEIPNEKVAIHERKACQEVTEANPEKMEPTDCAIDGSHGYEGKSRGNGVRVGTLGGYEEDDIVKPIKGRKKLHRGRHLAAG